MNIQELIAAVEHVQHFCVKWSGCAVHLGVDNTQAVGWLNKGAARPPEAMPYVKQLFWLALEHDFDLFVKHLPGVHNTIADAASRFLQEELDVAVRQWREQYTVLSLGGHSDV